MTILPTVGKAAYAVLFCVCLPLLLIVWSVRVEPFVRLPVIQDLFGGLFLAAIGFALLTTGMATLWRKGGGLPMNTYPPPRFVSSGVYGILPHPIYVGFCLVCIGVSIATGSPSGFWLVSPAVMLACVALVLGYERPDLERRFGPVAIGACEWLPVDDCAAPGKTDRLRFYIFVLLPWVSIYELITAFGVPAGAIDVRFAFERNLPIVQWTEFPYASAYLVVALLPLFIRTRRGIRELTLRAWIAMAVVFPLFVLLPLVAPFRPFVPVGPAGAALAWERSTNLPSACFPSFHVIWAVLAAEAIPARTRTSRVMWRLWAAAVAVSCITTGMHAIADVAAGLIVAILLIHRRDVWNWLRAGSERIANSWHEWRVGPVRVINHGFYAGAGTFIAYLIVGGVAGEGSEAAVLFTALSALAGAALWAQWIEGSPRLLRPYGFYGGVVGVIVSSMIAAPLFNVSAWLLMAAHCLAAPWLQSLGRLRCLVQGCCHGRTAPDWVGIRYTRPDSRVARIAHLAGVPVHATPLYSILWNAAIAPVMIRLWWLGAPLHLIAGSYLILSGSGRFVEEAYRGEPQTPVLGGLRLYQWVAVATVIAGAFITAVANSSGAPAFHLSWAAAANALLLGLIATAALGVDFPQSNRRFARLTN